MQLEFIEIAIARLGGLYLIVELLILALNPIPGTPEKWKAKKNNVLRRFFYYSALNVAVIWVVTL